MAGSFQQVDQHWGSLFALKKGTHLLKYCRKGKPKLHQFRISIDETTLIWYSHGTERKLKLSSVSRIVPGQRTSVFRRYLRPEKNHLSFSLIYNNGERSLDLICKDKDEAEAWFIGLSSLIYNDKHQNRRTKSELPNWNDSSSSNNIGGFHQNRGHNRASLDLGFRQSVGSFTGLDAGLEHPGMQLRTGPADGFRISISSTPSSSSHGSGPDDIESLGDVFIWGEIWSDSGSADSVEVFTPKPLESNVVLDVQQLACGVRHVALVTRQGEVFTWGQEAGGRLGHGVVKDLGRPRLVDYLAVTNVDSVSCGEYHTCAVSTQGDMYSWGNGTYNTTLLGHGTESSHWIPKRVGGSLEGLQVMSVACGTWHSAVTTTCGRLFTFGDGTFGALGHGDRETVTSPREVQLFSGLKTCKAACGVWHTAAIVEGSNHSGSTTVPRKLFTWGDGDKHRLGHGSKEMVLVPTMVSAVIDYNFQQVACGHDITVALTTSGHVFTMGSKDHGQLGNPTAPGTAPCLVQDKLVGEFVEEISCGTAHVAVLTSRNEVFTWGLGGKGRLGHGDTEDRHTPTMVEALRERLVRNISCGSNFTASICIHKWVSGVDQSICSGCHQAFGFTRKRHNCYNCGLVHCHACSSRKVLRAALASTPGKPHRVCDSCYAKLRSSEPGNGSGFNRRSGIPIHPTEVKDRGESKSSRVLPLSNPSASDPAKYVDVKAKGKTENFSVLRSAQVPSLSQLKDITLPGSIAAIQNVLKPALPSVLPPSTALTASSGRPISPMPSPPRPVTPVFSRNVIENLRKVNENLTQEADKLQTQVNSLERKCEARDIEIEKLRKHAREVSLMATHESSKCVAAKEAFKSVEIQLRELSEKLPPDMCESEGFKTMQSQIEHFLGMESVEAGDGEEHIRVSTENGAHRHEDGEQVMVHFEPGVYITFTRLHSGVKIFNRIKFSKRKFNSHQAEGWWMENKERVFEKYKSPS